MRFHFGAIPGSPDFTPDKSWKALREPTPWVMQLVALPIGVASAAAVALLWFVITPLRAATLGVTPFGSLLSLVGIVLVHELIHAFVHPLMGRSPHSTLGFWPSRALFYAHYGGELSRNRFLAIGLMPLFVISIAPLLIAAATQVASGCVAFVSSLNALLACVDIFGAVMALTQIPTSATVRNQGWRTYWRV